MSRPRKIKIRNLSFDLQLTVWGLLYCVSFHPFRYQEITFRGPNDAFASRFDPHGWSWHLFFGPLHFWGSDGFSSIFEITFAITQDGFYGGKLVPKQPRVKST